MKALRKLPKGMHAHSLSSFVNGSASVTKRGTVKLSIEIGIEQLESPYTDVRAVLSPEDNVLVPVLVFVEPSVVLAGE